MPRFISLTDHLEHREWLPWLRVCVRAMGGEKKMTEEADRRLSQTNKQNQTVFHVLTCSACFCDSADKQAADSAREQKVNM